MTFQPIWKSTAVPLVWQKWEFIYFSDGTGVNAMHLTNIGSIQNTDGIAALVIPLATYNVDHTHLNYMYRGSNAAHFVDGVLELLENF